MNDFSVHRIIGRGGFGEVRLKLTLFTINMLSTAFYADTLLITNGVCVVFIIGMMTDRHSESYFRN